MDIISRVDEIVPSLSISYRSCFIYDPLDKALPFFEAPNVRLRHNSHRREGFADRHRLSRIAPVHPGMVRLGAL